MSYRAHLAIDAIGAIALAASARGRSIIGRRAV
jgi:hypothetical protein